MAMPLARSRLCGEPLATARMTKEEERARERERGAGGKSCDRGNRRQRVRTNDGGRREGGKGSEGELPENRDEAGKTSYEKGGRRRLWRVVVVASAGRRGGGRWLKNEVIW